MLYAIGHFQTQSKMHTAMDRRNETAALLAEWKRDPHFMKQFDSDRDGEISIEEWQGARDKAMKIVAERARESALDFELHLMLRPPDGRPFILSVLPESEMTKRFRWHAIGGLAGFFLGGAAAVFLLTTRLAL